jgi:hypothetical protein
VRSLGNGREWLTAPVLEDRRRGMVRRVDDGGALSREYTVWRKSVATEASPSSAVAEALRCARQVRKRTLCSMCTALNWAMSGDAVPHAAGAKTWSCSATPALCKYWSSCAGSIGSCSAVAASGATLEVEGRAPAGSESRR